MSLPPQRSLIHATSFHDRVGSNCSFVQDCSEARPSTPLAWPTMLRKVRRSVRSMLMHQRGRIAMSIMLAIVILGGADSPLRKSLWRWPRICRSSVSTSAEHFAALARSMRFSTKSLSRMTYSWNQNGFFVADATSSIEQMLMVDSVNGTPNSSAARAASISPSACCIPVRPGRRQRHRHRHLFADHGAFQRSVGHVDQHALAQLDLAKSSSLAR